MKLQVTLLLLVIVILFAIVDLTLPAINYRPSRSVQAQQEWKLRTGQVIAIDDSTPDECQ